ncbi:MAG: hypothetical protein H6833_06095 [Planctomycetes bacterium]|nr:hypothetical protein [Planctomycetota bacterium]
MRMPRTALLTALCIACPSLFAQTDLDRPTTLRWQIAPSKLEFLRLQRDESGTAQALEIAVLRLVPDRGPKDVEFVDLVGVVHVGDIAYYRKLDRWLGTEYASRDGCVLFEMAHEEDPRDRMKNGMQDEEGGFGDMFRTMQRRFTDQLGLANQLDHIDYHKPHFVHADTSLQDAMRRRGDDELTILGGVLLDLMRGMNQEGQEGDPFGMGFGGPQTERDDPFAGLFGMGSKNPMTLKRQYAEQLASQDLSQGIPGLTTISDLLIDQRNAVCMQRFVEQRELGRRRFAILYGAAHMRDFAARLVLDHGMRPERIAWMTAWDLRDPGANALPRDATPEDLLDAFDGLTDEEKRELLKQLEERSRRKR